MIDDEGPWIGPIETAVREGVPTLGNLTGMQGALAEIAYAHARALDRGAARGMGAAAVGKELRETLDRLWVVGEQSDVVQELIAGLSAPLRDEENAGKGDAGAEGSEDQRDAGAALDELAKKRVRHSARG